MRIANETPDDNVDCGGRHDGHTWKATESTAAPASFLGTPTTATQPKSPSPTTTAAAPSFASFGGRSESTAAALVAGGRREEQQK